MYDRASAMPCFLANSSEQRTAAAAPQVGGQHWKRVSGSKTSGDARISSTRQRLAEQRERVLRRRACAPSPRSWRRSRAWCRTSSGTRGRRRRTSARPAGAWLKPCTRFITLDVLVQRVGAVGELGAERALLHLLEADREHALGRAARDRLAREVQRRRAGRAVVVHVDDRDAGEADLVDRRLAAGGVAVDVAGEGLLDWS